MGQLNSEVEVPASLQLDQLCAGALHELLIRGYCRRTANRYALVWQHLSEFARKQNFGSQYSRGLAMRFEEVYGHCDAKLLKPDEHWRRHLVFGLKILDDFARTGSIMRLVVERSGLHIPPAMLKPMHAYELYAKERRRLRMSSLQERMHSIAVFLDFLGTRGLSSLDQLKVDDISAFITSRPSWKARTVYSVTASVRLFLQYLFMCDFLPRDFSSAVPAMRYARHDTIPSVWDPELVTRLLAAVDRSLPKGKRDYAILLLAARLGMRTGDIRTLQLENLHWAEATIEIKQAKTGAPLVLPMSEEVGSALIDYLKSARPQCSHREVFLDLRPPFAPFCEKNHLYNVVTWWRQLAGIEFRNKQHKGLHSLRHTLATRLLQAETPLHVISAVLGHASSATTFIYAKADVELLRSAALNTEEVHHVQ